MKKIVIAILGMVFGFISSFAQPSSAYSLWYEYGDGNFLTNSFTSEDALYSYISTNLNTIGLGSNTGYRKINPHYVPTPPTLSVNSHSMTSNVLGWTIGKDINELTGALEIQTSTNDFISSDTLILALHYDKEEYQNATKVGFFYNSNGDQSFLPINNLSGLISVTAEPDGTESNIKQIRLHNNETPSTANSSMLSRVHSPTGSNYQNGIIFNLESIRKNASNIYISLLSNEMIEIDDNENFKLVFFDSKGNELKANNQEIINHSKLKSHDPNYETVNPTCITPSQINNHIANYDVHFQNIGEGPADSVMTFTHLPSGYTVNDIVDWNLPNKGIQAWKISGVSRNPAFDILISSESSGSILKLKLIRKLTALVPEHEVHDKPGRSISEVLVGTHNMNNPLNDNRTMGDFQFNLKLKNPSAVPVDLKSQTEIKFDTNALVNTNEAVIRVRNCCKCKEKDSNTNGNSNNSPCKCKSKFWKWLLCEKC